VSLEYDASPVGPYREYVTMGSLVTKRGALGQWGTRLFVRFLIERACANMYMLVAYLCNTHAPGAGGAMAFCL